MFGQEARVEVDQTMLGLDGQLDHLGEKLASGKDPPTFVLRICADGAVATSAEQRAHVEAESLAALSTNVMETHQNSLSRTSAMCDDIASLTSTLLASVSLTFLLTGAGIHG